jgi:hypothetical protein
MQFTIRQLLISVVVMGGVLGGLTNWYCWYNHEIARIELGNDYELRFWSEYENWRGPRRIMNVAVFQNETQIENFTLKGTHYRSVETQSSLLTSADGRYVAVNYPDNRAYILGDIYAGKFITSDHPWQLLFESKHGHKMTQAGPWFVAIESINKNNADRLITIR